MMHMMSLWYRSTATASGVDCCIRALNFFWLNPLVGFEVFYAKWWKFLGGCMRYWDFNVSNLEVLLC
uniref:Uncharacterized protein n=1 Tax=Arundo donax TaxID=35708 RepID=A0A0A9G2E8_ARUDO